MTGTPLRERPKAPIQVNIDHEAYARARALFEDSRCTFKSLSSFVEAIVFLMKSEYVENRSNDLVDLLAEFEKQRVSKIIDARKQAPRRALHLTFDYEAKEFLDMLVKKHRIVFKNRNALLTDMLLLATRRCDDPRKAGWVLARLGNVQESHPIKRSGVYSSAFSSSSESSLRLPPRSR